MPFIAIPRKTFQRRPVGRSKNRAPSFPPSVDRFSRWILPASSIPLDLPTRPAKLSPFSSLFLPFRRRVLIDRLNPCARYRCDVIENKTGFVYIIIPPLQITLVCRNDPPAGISIRLKRRYLPMNRCSVIIIPVPCAPRLWTATRAYAGRARWTRIFSPLRMTAG